MQLIPITGGAVIKIFAIDNTQPTIKWSIDGKAIFYDEQRDGIDVVWLQPIDGSARKQVTHFESGDVWFHDVTPDGKALVASHGEETRDAVLITNVH